MKEFSVIIVFLSMLSLGAMYKIAFPEDDPVADKESKDERVPVYIPGKCPPNQLYFPGNQKTDWVCDCAPGFVWYASTDKCHELYRKGPCLDGQYLTMQNSGVQPECVRNPCVNDTMVPFKDSCQPLYKKDGCPPLHLGGGTLGVNITTMQLECLAGNPVELNIVKIPIIPCPTGSRRALDGSCRPVIMN